MVPFRSASPSAAGRQSAPRGVDQDRARLHSASAASRPNVGLRGEWAVQADEVGRRQQVVERSPSCPRQCIEKPYARRATARPIRPKPTIPTFARDAPSTVRSRCHPAPIAARTERAASGRRRAAANIRAIAKSAVTSVSTSGVLSPRSVERALRRGRDTHLPPRSSRSLGASVRRDHRRVDPVAQQAQQPFGVLQAADQLLTRGRGITSPHLDLVRWRRRSSAPHRPFASQRSLPSCGFSRNLRPRCTRRCARCPPVVSQFGVVRHAVEHAGTEEAMGRREMCR